MARVLERVMSREVGGMMEGVQRVAGVAQAGGEGFALAGDGVRVDFSTGLRGGIGDSGNETADDGGGNDGQDGAGRGKVWPKAASVRWPWPWPWAMAMALGPWSLVHGS